MKVLNFLQHETDEEISLEWYNDFHNIIIRKGYIDAYDIPMVAQFFAQPFNPEMIVELFEGWEEGLDNYVISKYYDPEEGHFAKYRYIIEIDFPYKIYKVYEYKQELKEELVYFSKPPRTLDEFIIDCQRAGIELEWRTK